MLGQSRDSLLFISLYRDSLPYGAVHYEVFDLVTGYEDAMVQSRSRVQLKF
jgi:hypothetical protein